MDATWVSSDRLELFTDASGQIGYGAVFGSKNGRPATTTLVAKFNKPHDI
jgi:hypothetical protein